LQPTKTVRKENFSAVFMYMFSLSTGLKGKEKSNFIPEQDMKTQMGSSSIAILSLTSLLERGWMVNATPSLIIPGKYRVPVVWEGDAARILSALKLMYVNR
jgi:hypothetical protein